MDETERVSEESEAPATSDQNPPNVEPVDQGDPGPPEMEYFEKGRKVED